MRAPALERRRHAIQGARLLLKHIRERRRLQTVQLALVAVLLNDGSPIAFGLRACADASAVPRH